MKKCALILLLALPLFSANEPITELAAKSKSKKQVYICDSEGAKKYHLTKDCEGLKTCKHEILEVSLKEAQKRGKTSLCGYEN